MRIDYERTGGFAGMRMAASFDLDKLAEQDADKIRALLENAEFTKLPGHIQGQPSMPDQFTYTITVSTETEKHTVSTGDASAPPELRALLELLNQLARQSRG